MRLPLEANGLAPRISRYSVRSMSGIGMLSAMPNMSPADTCLGIWSTVPAEYKFLLPTAWMRTRL